MKETLSMLLSKAAPPPGQAQRPGLLSTLDGVFMNSLSFVLLKTFAFLFNRRPSLNRYLAGEDGWINFTIGFATLSGNINYALIFKDGKIRLRHQIPQNADTILNFKDETALRTMLKSSPTQTLIMIIENTIQVTGNMAYMSLFSYYLALLVHKKQAKLMEDEIQEDRDQAVDVADKITSPTQWSHNRPTGEAVPPTAEAPHLPDPALSRYSLADFPRLAQFKERFFTTRFSMCTERPALLTDWYRDHGFETDDQGNAWDPIKRQGKAFRHLMEGKAPRIGKHDLLAGTTTTKDIGVILYPDARNAVLWGELKSMAHRLHSPYDITEEEEAILHNKIFPFWTQRNFTEWVRKEYDAPLFQQLDDRLAVYFLWKTVALSHTVVDFPMILKKGIRGIIQDIQATPHETDQHRILAQAMVDCLGGVTAYARNLADHAREQARLETDAHRKLELERMAANCRRVPEQPAQTLDQALQAIWIGWIAVHMENTNAGFSLGRMDQWLQPYFEADIQKLKTQEEKENYISQAIEWVGDFCMRCTDHVPAVPDFGNQLFGGSSSNQVITLGGVTPGGTDGVNDMTYIFLKVTELLKFKDPNMNARYHPEINSATYLKRLCEVNLLTGATPALHNDAAMVQALAPHGYSREEMNDWVAIGCVEPTIPGKHLGHTNCMMFNMVAALEMLLYNGYHPPMDW